MPIIRTRECHLAGCPEWAPKHIDNVVLVGFFPQAHNAQTVYASETGFWRLYWKDGTLVRRRMKRNVLAELERRLNVHHEAYRRRNKDPGDPPGD